MNSEKNLINAKTIIDHGISKSEYKLILRILKREPNLLELGIFSVMWSEHCSYKSTKKWLKTLPTNGEQGMDTTLQDKTATNGSSLNSLP